MEQLVHLRLKSIYKAFSTNPTEHCCVHNEQAQKERADAAAAELLAELEEEEEKKERKNTKKKKKKKPPKDEEEEPTIRDTTTTPPPPDIHTTTTTTEPMLQHHDSSIPQHPPDDTVDPLEDELAELVQANDTEGLERLLASVKGVPGMGAFRKNAKKALKRIRADFTIVDEPEHEPVEESNVIVQNDGPLGPDEMLRLISDSKRSRGGFECVMHMAPSIVGWVIGKGGQRIRDMMDESGARIWIDQDSMSSTEPRIVYVSGQRHNVDEAVTAIQELIAAAPAVASPRAACAEGVTGISSAPAIPEDTTNEESQPVSLKPRCKTKLTCEPRYVPLLIGRRGWTIKNIQDTTGAKVDIDQTVSPRQITITGRKEAVEEAKAMVEDVLSYPHAHPLEEEGEVSKPNIDETADLKPEAKKVPTPPASPVRTPSVKAAETTTPILVERQITSSEKRLCSPPSSLIMNHDVKSTVSVSSSLSSTPEPSSRKINPTITTAVSSTLNGAHMVPPAPPQSPLVNAGSSPMYHGSPFPSQMPFMSSSPHMSHPVNSPPTPAFGTMGYPPPAGVPNYMPYAPVPPMGPPMQAGWNPGHPPMAPPAAQQPYYSPDNGMVPPNNNTATTTGIEPMGPLMPRSMPKELSGFPSETSTSDAKVVDSLFGDDSSTKELIMSGLKGLGLGGDSEGLWTAGTESSLFSSTWGESERR